MVAKNNLIAENQMKAAQVAIESSCQYLLLDFNTFNIATASFVHLGANLVLYIIQIQNYTNENGSEDEIFNSYFRN